MYERACLGNDTTAPYIHMLMAAWLAGDPNADDAAHPAGFPLHALTVRPTAVLRIAVHGHIR